MEITNEVPKLTQVSRKEITSTFDKASKQYGIANIWIKDYKVGNDYLMFDYKNIYMHSLWQCLINVCICISILES